MDKEKLSERQRTNIDSILSQLENSLSLPPSPLFLKATEFAIEIFVERNVWNVLVSLDGVFFNLIEFIRTSGSEKNCSEELRRCYLFTEIFLKNYQIQYSQFSEKFIRERGDYLAQFPSGNAVSRLEIDGDAGYLFDLSAQLAENIFGSITIQGEHLILCFFSHRLPSLREFLPPRLVDVEELLYEWVESMNLSINELDLWKRAFQFIECDVDLSRIGIETRVPNKMTGGSNDPESESWRDLETPDTDDDLDNETQEEGATTALFIPKEELGRAPSRADEPASKIEDDLLGRDHLVEALAEMIADEKQGTPFTIGLLGRWGAGKSTVMKMLEGVLRKHNDGDRFEFAEFNAGV